MRSSAMVPALGPSTTRRSAIYEAIGDRKGLLNVREALVFILLHSGDLAAARAVGRQTLADFRIAGELACGSRVP